MAEEKTLEENVKEAIDMFRPQLQADGGDMEFVGIDEEKKVHLNLLGACGSCPMALMTLKMGVERYIKDACPEITEVVQDNAKNSSGMDFGDM
jgi:Fe-S cluster biogenesis protein NfuA